MIRNLFVTLGEVADSTANGVLAQQRSLDSLAKIVQYNHAAFHHPIAEQESACVIANTTCYTWRNSSGEGETQLHKMRERARCLQ